MRTSTYILGLCTLLAFVLLLVHTPESRRSIQSGIGTFSPPSSASMSPAVPAHARSPQSPAPPAAVPAAPAAAPAAAPPDVTPGHWEARDLSDPAVRDAWSAAVHAREARERPSGESAAAKAGLPVEESRDGEGYQFVTVRDGRVYVRTTRNQEAAISTAADLVRRRPPYNLDGAGRTVGVWDQGSIRSTHQEFTGRLTLRNAVSAINHSTHVGGTIGASGVVAHAQGMAPGVKLDSYDWNFDTAEMIAAAMATSNQTAALQLSNHSYGFQAGWYGTVWYGTWGDRESDSFGLYDSFAVEQDEVAYNAPYFLPVRASGNDRNDDAPSEGTLFTYFDDLGGHTKAYDPATDPRSDNGNGGGYDTIALESNAKNILTVGAVNDAVAGGTRSLAAATMTSFSSWGPTDDGRVKPDVVANGEDVYSTYAGGDAFYSFSSGTSMASPNAAGTAVLLIQHYGNRFTNRFMRASTLKGLLIHTADDVGPAGPDYRFGWGLVNAAAAVAQIDAQAASPATPRLLEDRLTNVASTNRYRILWDRVSPLKATLCWTDPPGLARDTLNDRNPVLVHDLDLRIIAPDGAATFLPYVLSATNPAALATTGDNAVDNVEQVRVAAPPAPGEYEVRVSTADPLLLGQQVYSLVISGATTPPVVAHTPLQNTTNDAAPVVVEARITSEIPLDASSLWLWWTTGESGGTFASNRLAPVAVDAYRAEIPPQPAGTVVRYYLAAQATNGIAGFSPLLAPAEVHRFVVVRPITLFVTGQPARVPGVDPPYGFNAYPSGVVVRATAPLFSPASNGVRQVCTGWTGCCGIPSMGTTNVVEFPIHEDSFLAWQWSPAYRLAQTGSVAGAVDAESWWPAGATGRTEQAVVAIRLNGTNYAFASWMVDGARMPDATNRASNPASGFTLEAPRQAVAVYLPTDQDRDRDGVADWWETLYFGGTNAPLSVDSDGDGFSDLKEFQDATDPRDATSTPTPPSIAHSPLTSLQARPAPWGVTATVTDNDGVAQVSLEWRRNGAGWQSLAALPLVSAGSYTSAIPAPGVTGDHFEYRFAARDRAGLLAYNGPYTLSVAYPVSVVSPADLGSIQLPGGGSDRRTMLVSNTGDQPLNWTMRLLPNGLLDDAEGGTNGWTHGGVGDAWHLAPWRAYSGSNAWYLGNDSSRQYPDSVKAWLMSPPVLVAGNATFSFRHWLSTEAIKDAQHAWDGGIVEISTNGGAAFEQIAPVGGYPYAIYGHSASAFADNTPCFAGTGGWQRAEFNLAAYAGQMVRLRLTFGADAYVVNEGWYVDDIQVLPYGGAPDWVNATATGGTVASHDMFAMQLFIASARLAPAETRRGALYVESNDPLTPFQMIPIALHSLARRIVVSLAGEGTVEPPGPVVLNVGQSAGFAIKAAPYYHIGDLRTNGTAVSGAPFGFTSTNFVWSSVSFDGDGSLRVVFAPNLTTNGVPEPWLVGYGLTNQPFAGEAMADRDGDHQDAWQEYIAGTDPTNAASALQIDAMRAVGSENVWVATWTNELGQPTVQTQCELRVEGHVLEWSSVSGRVYTILGAPSPAGPFIPLSGPLAATPPLNRRTNAVGEAAGFYRISVDLAAP